MFKPCPIQQVSRGGPLKIKTPSVIQLKSSSVNTARSKRGSPGSVACTVPCFKGYIEITNCGRLPIAFKAMTKKIPKLLIEPCYGVLNSRQTASLSVLTKNSKKSSLNSEDYSIVILATACEVFPTCGNLIDDLPLFWKLLEKDTAGDAYTDAILIDNFEFIGVDDSLMEEVCQKLCLRGGLVPTSSDNSSNPLHSLANYQNESWDMDALSDASGDSIMKFKRTIGKVKELSKDFSSTERSVKRFRMYFIIAIIIFVLWFLQVHLSMLEIQVKMFT